MLLAITGLTSTNVKLISALAVAVIVVYYKFKTQKMKLKHSQEHQDKQLKREELRIAERELKLREREMRLKERDFQLYEKKHSLCEDTGSGTHADLADSETTESTGTLEAQSDGVDKGTAITGSTGSASQIQKMKDF